MKKLLIDDMRDANVDVIARNYQAGVELLISHKWDLLLLDHDLGSFIDGKEKTGYDILCFLEENPQYLPGKIELVTSNPVGQQKMKPLIAKLYGDRNATNQG